MNLFLIWIGCLYLFDHCFSQIFTKSMWLTSVVKQWYVQLNLSTTILKLFINQAPLSPTAAMTSTSAAANGLDLGIVCVFVSDRDRITEGDPICTHIIKTPTVSKTGDDGWLLLSKIYNPKAITPPLLSTNINETNTHWNKGGAWRKQAQDQHGDCWPNEGQFW